MVGLSTEMGPNTRVVKGKPPPPKAVLRTSYDLPMPRPQAPADGLPERLSPQLATLVDAPPKGVGWVYEIKLDGYRILARCDGGTVWLYTRNENDWTAKIEPCA